MEKELIVFSWVVQSLGMMEEGCLSRDMKEQKGFWGKEWREELSSIWEQHFHGGGNSISKVMGKWIWMRVWELNPKVWINRYG